MVRIFATVFALLAMAGCGATGGRTCVPGTVQRCPCPGSQEGTQICEDDGRKWGECKNCTAWSDGGLDAGDPDGPMIDALPKDAPVPDTLSVDLPVPDALSPDRSKPDARPLDAPLPDTRPPDLFLPDALMPDALMPDALIPDLPVPDLPVPDLPVPDLPVPDLPVPDLSIPDFGTCPIHTGSKSLASAARYGFCWYLSKPGETCDQVCKELGGKNLAVAASNAWPDNCPKAQSDDMSTYFYNNGNACNWTGVAGSTSGKTLGYGYTGMGYYGKCVAGTVLNVGTFPGTSNSWNIRCVICPCF